MLDFLIPEIEPATLSLTELRKGMATRGHSHPSQEAYLFLSPAVLETGRDGKTRKRDVVAGEVALIEEGEFHRVWTKAGEEARFVSVFLGRRDENRATYDRSRGYLDRIFNRDPRHLLSRFRSAPTN